MVIIVSNLIFDIKQKPIEMAQPCIKGENSEKIIIKDKRIEC